MSGRYITIGKVAGLFGVSGWVKVHSYTSPRHGIVSYSSWRLLSNGAESDSPPLEASRRHGNGVIAKFLGVDDRDAAAALTGCDIAVEAAQLKPLTQGEYYCFELIGLEVFDSGGRMLGVVREFFETGANDVMIVEKDGNQCLIPYVIDTYVKCVDLKNGRMEVDWKPEWS